MPFFTLSKPLSSSYFSRITIPNPSQKETLLEVSRQTVEENKVEKIFLKALGERAKLVKIWSLGIQQNLGISKVKKLTLPLI